MVASVEEIRSTYCWAALLTNEFKGNKKIVRSYKSELFWATHGMKSIWKRGGFLL